MKVLIIGDIFGKTGRKVVKNYLTEAKEVDLVIANVENTTHGKGISLKHYEELKRMGINVMTSGNHIFYLEETRKKINELSILLRPANFNPYHPGQGSMVIKCKEKRIRITNLIGQAFMPHADNPYFIFEKFLEEKDYDIHLVDFHAEASAEKNVFAWYFDGKITALWGTHTHVQTADERILPKGTAFITDVGMTGPQHGIIGAQPQAIIQRSKYGFSAKMLPSEDNGKFNGIILEINEISNQVISIKRININY